MAESTIVKIAKMEIKIENIDRDMKKIDTKLTSIKKFLFSEGEDGLIEKLNECFATKEEVKNVKDSLRLTQKILFFVGGATITWLISFALGRIFSF